MTGQTHEFIKKIKKEFPDMSYHRIEKNKNLIVRDPFLLFTPTYKMGGVPDEVTSFLEKEKHKYYIQAVVSSGNKNWGPNFAKAGEHISSQYSVPLLHQYEIRGTQKDVDTVLNIIEEL